MSVWTEVSGFIMYDKTNKISLKKRGNSYFDSCTVEVLSHKYDNYRFNFYSCFCDEGVSSVKTVEKFVKELKRDCTGFYADLTVTTRVLA